MVSWAGREKTIIIPSEGELICSPWVQQNIKLDPELVMNKYFYKQDDVIYFIYSKYFPEIWEVKVLFDTTSYITSQLIIIKIWLIFIFLVFFLQFFAGRYISSWLLKDLKNIWAKLKNIDINSREKHITCDCMPDDDEIKILANALNDSYDTIDEQTSKLKQFLTDVSHEFKASKWKLDDSDIREHFISTKKNITKLNWLLESLFFLSRIEEQKWCLIKHNIQLRDYMNKKVQSIAESFPDKILSYSLDISDDVVYQVEENTFSILIDNLLTNAMKFSPENMEILVSADKNWFYIQDNGPWIDSKNRDLIWEKFYRKDTNKEWFWVGLYLVKRITKLYAWNIYVEDTSDQWARFKVEIR